MKECDFIFAYHKYFISKLSRKYGSKDEIEGR